MTFAEKVKEARKQLGLSQEKFAGKMGVSFSTINRWKKGRFLPSYLAQAQFDSFCKDNPSHAGRIGGTEAKPAFH